MFVQKCLTLLGRNIGLTAECPETTAFVAYIVPPTVSQFHGHLSRLARGLHG